MFNVCGEKDLEFSYKTYGLKLKNFQKRLKTKILLNLRQIVEKFNFRSLILPSYIEISVSCMSDIYTNFSYFEVQR